MQEFTLLPGVTESVVVRGPQKSGLVAQALIRNELEINTGKKLR